MRAKSWELDETLLERLRVGDESAFTTLVEALHARLLAMAGTFTSSPALAEDIVQETWIAVIRGLRGFEGRSSLRTWIYSILVRRARTLAAREARRGEVPAGLGGSEPESAVEWDLGRGRKGLWEVRPTPWGFDDPAAVYQSQEALKVVEEALDALPALQRQVVLLRDVEDVPGSDICNILEISETNRRVLLHRGRARIRRALDRYVRGEASQAGLTREGSAATAPAESRNGTERKGSIDPPERAREEKHGMR